MIYIGFKNNNFYITDNVLDAYFYPTWYIKEKKLYIGSMKFPRDHLKLEKLKNVQYTEQFNKLIDSIKKVYMNYSIKHTIIQTEKHLYEEFKNFTMPPNITNKQGDILFSITKNVNSIIDENNNCMKYAEAIMYKAIENNIPVFKLSVGFLDTINNINKYQNQPLDYEILTSDPIKRNKKITKILIGHAVLIFKHNNVLWIIDPYHDKLIYTFKTMSYITLDQRYKYDTLETITLNEDREFVYGEIDPISRKYIRTKNTYVLDELFNNYLMKTKNKLNWYKKTLSKCTLPFIKYYEKRFP